MIVQCALCGIDVEVQPEQLSELPSHRDLNFFCVLCGCQMANALEDSGISVKDHVRMFNPLSEGPL